MYFYVSQPSEIYCHLSVGLNLKTGVTKSKVSINIDQLAINFEDNQFREIILFSTNISNFYQLEEYSMYRPKTTVYEAPAAWWRLRRYMIQIH
jgi:hypothetical protein